MTIAYCAHSTLCQSAFCAIICAPFKRHLNEIKEQTADPTRLDRIQVLTFILHACDICHPVPGSNAVSSALLLSSKPFRCRLAYDL